LQFITFRFEDFKTPKLYLGNQSVLSLFSTGRTTGTVLDSGEGVTHAVPIYEGYAIPHAVQTINLSGRDLTSYLHQLIKERFPREIGESYDDFKEIKKVKEKICVVA
jgi:actin